ncbi:MAG: hypothetical protein K2G67_07965 [Muribaculaceae bacterium]|nr:hypothetical protein [Muribaculaceae bacterium]
MGNKSSEIRREEEKASEAARANYKDKKNETTRKNNKLWLWLGVLILIFILLYWLFSIGLFEDASGVINGN